MTWVRIDDGMPDHPKFAEPDDEDAALALWVRAVCYCNRNRTDGFVSQKKVRSLSRAADPCAVASQLVAAGLWEPVDGGYQFHDYADYQPLRAQLEARYAIKSAAGRAGGVARAQAKRKHEPSKAVADSKHGASTVLSKTEAELKPDPDPDPIDESRACVREEQEECQDGKGHSDNCNIDHKEVGGGSSADGDDHDPGLARLPSDGHGAEGMGGRPGRETGKSGSSEMCGVRVGDQDADLDRGGAGLHGGDAACQPVPLTPGRAPEPPEDPEGLLGVLARLVAEGQPWARDVEAWRQENTGRALTEGHRKVLRKERDRQDRARPALTAQDEADARAMVEAYVGGHRRIIKDRGYVALQSHMADAVKMLPDARRLAERARRGEWAPTPAEVVAHKLESYMRNPKWGPEFALRFLFDRTEQDDLPRPKTVLPEARAAPPKLQRVLPTDEEKAEIEKRKEDIGRIGLGPTPKRRK